ncbi:MAG TPA: TonB family protein [Terriglobales bacterium]|nr:TonB family protein [Terriglobales bacterium]
MTTRISWSSSPLLRSSARAFLILCFAVTVAVLSPRVRAEDPAPRKLITRVAPKYPEYLRTHEIGGVVRLTIVVSPAGNVKTITPVGGNPILVDAASDAVKLWKYAPAENTDTFEVKLDFVPRSQ